METVKRARKIMRILLIIPICLCLLAVVGYFLTGKDDYDILILLSGWTMCSVLMVLQAEGAIKTLEQKNELLTSGGSANTPDATTPEDEQ